MTNYDRVSVTVGGILLGLILMLVLEMPSRSFQFNPLGTPLTFHITGIATVSTLLVGLACAGTETVMRTHPLVRKRVVRYTFPAWVLPGLATLALALYLPRSPSLIYWLVGLLFGGVAIAWLILTQYQLLDLSAAASAPVRTVRSLIGYLLALVLFIFVSQTRSRSLVSATSITIIAFLISLTVLATEDRALRTTVLYAALIGLILGQTTWALNYWRAGALTIGVLLMLLFYIFSGVARERLRGALSRRTVLEFLALAVIGISIIAWLGRR